MCMLLRAIAASGARVTFESEYIPRIRNCLFTLETITSICWNGTNKFSIPGVEGGIS